PPSPTLFPYTTLFRSKDWSIYDIAGAARMVGLGMTLFAPVAHTRNRMLSERELEVLDLIGAGRTNREIAEKLYLSPHTVKDHTRSEEHTSELQSRRDL